MANINISWNAPTDGGSVVDYEICYVEGLNLDAATISTSGSKQTVTQAHDANVDADGKQAYQHTGLSQGDSFSYTVRARNAAGEGPYATAASATA